MLTLSSKPPWQAEMTFPGDKSISHRAFLLGALAPGTTRIEGVAPCGDCLATIDAMRTLGVSISRLADDAWEIAGVDGPGGLSGSERAIDCRNSGTTARLLMGILAGAPFSTRLIGDDSLCRRPMERVMLPLEQMGAGFLVERAPGRLPLLIEGKPPLRGISYLLPVASAQVKSALLLAGAFADGPTVVAEPWRVRDHTERMLLAMGADLHQLPRGWEIRPGHRLQAGRFRIPGDPSSAAFFVTAAAINPGSRLTVRGVGLNPTRVGYLDILLRMGAEIRVQPEQDDGWEPRGEILVEGRPLKGIEILPEEVPGIIDELPILAVAMAVAEGPSRVRGASELRVKESDRIASLIDLFTRFGIVVEEAPDGFDLAGGARPIAPAEPFSTAFDHRIAMTGAILGTIASGDTRIGDAECIDISFPEFSEYLGKLVPAVV